MNRKLSLGFSSCPNDTFVFDALVNNKIHGNGLSFDVTMADVEALNELAVNSQLDIVKISFHAYLHVQDRYQLLNAGSALGHGCGPIVIAREQIDLAAMKDVRIGIPGTLTTANLLLQLYLGRRISARVFVFNQIEDALIKGDIDAGVIIHENRFTYEGRGLKKIVDLGEFWEKRYCLPIPLGCIVARRSLPPDVISSVDNLLAQSIDFAMENPASSRSYVLRHAQELDETVVQNHIDLYVTGYTRNLGAEGHKAVKQLQLASAPILVSFA